MKTTKKTCVHCGNPGGMRCSEEVRAAKNAYHSSVLRLAQMLVDGGDMSVAEYEREVSKVAKESGRKYSVVADDARFFAWGE